MLSTSHAISCTSRIDSRFVTILSGAASKCPCAMPLRFLVFEVKSKITWLPLGDIDLGKCSIRNSGAVLGSSVINVELLVLARVVSMRKVPCKLLDVPNRLSFQTKHRYVRLLLWNRQVTSPPHRHHFHRDEQIDQERRIPSTFNPKSSSYQKKYFIVSLPSGNLSSVRSVPWAWHRGMVTATATKIFRS
jgi:hypothetical protein